MDRKIILSPSLLSGDFACLKDSISTAEKGGADWLHIDAMDGHFVPNITIGPVVVESIRKVTNKVLDCHLMIEHPDQYIEQFANAGADIITVHVEAVRHLNRTVALIKSFGKKAGVCLNPATPLVMLQEILPDVDLVLLMSVNPGFGGQKFLPSLFERARALRREIKHRELHCVVEADGGIKLDNVRAVFEAGVDAVVSGSGVFGTNDPAETLREMRRECERAFEVSV